MKWEVIEEGNPTIMRSKVPNGWLVMSSTSVITQVPDSMGNYVTWENRFGYEERHSITFVPDPKHEWIIENATT